MTDLSKLTACVCDSGLFVELALRLKRDGFGRVLYWSPNECGFPTVQECCIGDGMEEIERIEDFWPVKDEIDAWIFPDIHFSGLQKELISQGRHVWGSRTGDSLEMERAGFKGILNELGLEVGPYRVCRGLSELSDYLREKKDCWIKMSKFRGTWETKHWVDWKTSKALLEGLACKLGPLQECVPFIVEDAIETVVEWGYDGYFSGGKYPSLSAHGPEIKDKCYAASIVKYSDLPDVVKEVNEAMAPVLAKHDYCNFWSTELRITEDGRAYFIDPCCRMPSPSGEAQSELYANLPEIVWAGACGESVDPEPAAQFCVEAMIDHNDDESGWRKLMVPDEIRRFVKLYNVCRNKDGFYCLPPLQHSFPTIGAVLGLGDTMEEAIKDLQSHVEALKDEPVTIHVDSLMSALKEIEEAKEQDVEFSPDKMPPPESVLQDA